jgi:hypothetical protein
VTEIPQIIVPRPGGTAKPYETPAEHWEELCDEMYGSHELPQNIRHEHDEHWDRRFWSIQNAHDQWESKHFGPWSVIAAVFLLMDLTWYFRIRF